MTKSFVDLDTQMEEEYSEGDIEYAPVERLVKKDSQQKSRPAFSGGVSAKSEDRSDDSDDEVVRPGSRSCSSAAATHKQSHPSKPQHQVLSSHQSSRVTKPAKKRSKKSVDPMTGLSQSKGAMDSRQRKEEERQLKQRLESVIDYNLLQRAEMEGGIIPAGRMYKAAFWMFERLEQQNGETKVSKSKGAAESDQIKKLEKKVQELNDKLDQVAAVVSQR